MMHRLILFKLYSNLFSFFLNYIKKVRLILTPIITLKPNYRLLYFKIQLCNPN